MVINALGLAFTPFGYSRPLGNSDQPQNTHAVRLSGPNKSSSVSDNIGEEEEASPGSSKSPPGLRREERTRPT